MTPHPVTAVGSRGLALLVDPFRALSRARWSGPLGLTVLIGLPVLLAGTAVVVRDPVAGPGLALTGVLGLVVAVVSALLLNRVPWLVPWGALTLFCLSGELRLRVSPVVGAAKDAYIALLAGLLVFAVVRRRSLLIRLRPFIGPLACLGVTVGLYLANPAGGHGSSWVFGTRLLLEVLALLVIGMLCLDPARTCRHLVRAMCVALPVEAVFAWLQQSAGAAQLVYVWGYQYGAQMRVTNGGGLRTSGTFEDPFQLAALAGLGTALALFVATGRQAAVLLVSAAAVLAATSVRTAALQVAVLLLVYAVRRGWWRQALGLAAVAAVGGVFMLATTTTATRPGAPEESLLLNLNGRSDAWAQAVQDGQSLVVGNGVGARGIGSTRAATLISAPPEYDPTVEPTANFAGDPAFLDSAYAQVQSDVGLVGTVGLVAGLVGLLVVLGRRRDRGGGAAWAAFAVLLVSMIDWVGRSSLASYTTGFLTMYVLGVLVAASTPAPATEVRA